MGKIGYIVADFGSPSSKQKIDLFLKAYREYHGFSFSLLKNLRDKLSFKKKYHESLNGFFCIQTQNLAFALEKIVRCPVISFDLFIPEKNDDRKRFFQEIEEMQIDEWHIFPTYPIFSYSLTGNITSFLKENIFFKKKYLNKFFFVKSYSRNVDFIHLYQEKIKEFLKQNNLNQQDSIFIFSAYALFEKFNYVDELYQKECSYLANQIIKAFPYVVSKLSYDSFFEAEKNQKIKPSTYEECKKIKNISSKRKNIIFIAISYTKYNFDIFLNIEKKIFPIIKSQNLIPYLFPPFDLDKKWLYTIKQILEEKTLNNKKMLVYKSF